MSSIGVKLSFFLVIQIVTVISVIVHYLGHYIIAILVLARTTVLVVFNFQFTVATLNADFNKNYIC